MKGSNSTAQNSKRFLLCLIVALSLVGCSRTVWQKQGAFQGEFEQAKAACLLEGHDRVPQDNRVYLMSEGRRYSKDKCKNDKDCTVTTQYAPPQYGVHDQNDDLREQVVRACLYRNGWNEVKLEE